MGAVLLSALALGAKNARTTANKSNKLNESWYEKYPRLWASFTNPVLHEFNAYQQDKKLEDLEAKKRNSTGVGGEAALKKAANSTRAIMNQQLQSNIDTINTAYGTAGRYGSGANKQAVLQAQNSTNFNLANVVNQMSLQESQFQRNLEEERAWRQASLDAGQPSRASQVGDILQTGVSMYMQNPEGYNKMLGIGGDNGMMSAPESEPQLQEFNPLSEEIKTGYLKPNAGIMDILPQRYPTKVVPSFMAPQQQVVEKPVSQWVEEDFSSNVSTLPTNPVEFFSSVDNIKTFSNSLNYVISNHLDDGELAQVSLEYSLTGDIGKVIEWLLSKGVVLDGSSSLQSK